MSIIALSESAANTLHSFSNVVVLIAAIAGVSGAVGLFWAGGVKETYATLNELKTQQRISEANATAAIANERAKILEQGGNE